MITKKHLMLIAVGACVLGLASLASQKNRVERPLAGILQVTGVITLGEQEPLSLISDGSGQLSPLGPLTSLGIGVPDGSGDFFLTGTMTVASGEQLFWEAAGPTVTHIVGGTGRFEGASGSFTAEYTRMEYRPGPFPGIVIIDMTALAEGTITY